MWTSPTGADWERSVMRQTEVAKWNWVIDLYGIPASEFIDLEDFFADVVDGPASTFSYTHTDGRTYTVRFADTEIARTRRGNKHVDITFEIEMVGTQPDGTGTSTSTTTTTTQTSSTSTTTTSTTTTTTTTTSTTTTTAGPTTSLTGVVTMMHIQKNDVYLGHDGFTATIQDSFTGAGDEGVEWNGSSDLMTSGSVEGKGYRHSGFVAAVNDSFDFPAAPSAGGISWDGSNALIGYSDSGQIVGKMSGFSASLVDSFTCSEGRSDALHWLGAGNFWRAWYLAGAVGKCAKHDGFAATILDSFDGQTQTHGFTHQGSNATIGWYDKHGKCDGYTSTITDSYDLTAGSYPQDLDFTP